MLVRFWHYTIDARNTGFAGMAGLWESVSLGGKWIRHGLQMLYCQLSSQYA